MGIFGDRFGRTLAASVGIGCMWCGARTDLGFPDPADAAAHDASGPDAVAPDAAPSDAGALDATPRDASNGDAGDASARDSGTIDSGGDSGVLGAPRLIAPMSTATVSSQRPRLRWALGAGEDGARVDVCADRACATVVTSFDANGTSGALPTSLARGVYFWRARGLRGVVVGTATSAVWEFFVGARSAPVDASWGSTLDVNGDGIADVVTAEASGIRHINVYLGSRRGLGAPIQMTPGATELANAGDVNGDGFPDLLATRLNTEVDLYFGGETGFSTPPVVVPGTPVPVYNRVSIAGVGDVNGDGYADVAIGVNNGTLAHVAYVYYGGPRGLGATPTALSGTDFGFGLHVASAGDINGDGFAELLVGSNPGVTLFMGSAGGISTTATYLPQVLGSPPACAGDVNGDGYADVVGSGGAGTHVVLGSAGGLSATIIALLLPGGVTINYAATLASAGDVNGDGFGDVVAADEYDKTGVFLGNAGGIASTPVTTFVGAWNGKAVGVGDVNVDGFDDIVDGSRDASQLYLGSANGTSAAWSVQLDGGAAIARLAPIPGVERDFIPLPGWRLPARPPTRRARYGVRASTRAMTEDEYPATRSAATAPGGSRRGP